MSVFINGEPSTEPIVIKFSAAKPGHNWIDDCRKILDKTDAVAIIRVAPPEVRKATFLRYKDHIRAEFEEMMTAETPEEFFLEGCDMTGLFIEEALLFDVDISTIWANIWGPDGSNQKREPGDDPRRPRIEGEPMDLIKPPGWKKPSAKFLVGTVPELGLNFPLHPKEPK